MTWSGYISGQHDYFNQRFTIGTPKILIIWIFTFFLASRWVSFHSLVLTHSNDWLRTPTTICVGIYQAQFERCPGANSRRVLPAAFIFFAEETCTWPCMRGRMQSSARRSGAITDRANYCKIHGLKFAGEKLITQFGDFWKSTRLFRVLINTKIAWTGNLLYCWSCVS